MEFSFCKVSILLWGGGPPAQTQEGTRLTSFNIKKT